jgi:exosortase/archaeosortase family protein
MDVSQITHVKRGNIIEIASKPLFVEEACSGVDSQYALMAVAGVLLLLGNTKLIVSLITIVTVPIWAILGNLLRIYSIVIGLEFLGVDLSTGTTHTVLGLIVFMIAAWAHWSSVQLLVYLQESFLIRSSIPPRASLDTPIRRTDASAEKLNLGWAWLILPGCALLLMPAGGLGLYNHLRTRMPYISQDVADQFPGKGDLPLRFMDQTMVDYRTESRKERNLFGQHSHTWFYQGKLGRQSASLDFVFREFHPLWICYSASGWEEQGIKRITIDDFGKQEQWPYYEILLENKQNEYASVYFGFFDENGNQFDYDHTTLNGEDFQRPRTFLDIIKPPRDLGNPLLFQFQLLTTTNEPLAEEQLTSHRQQFKSLRDRIHSATSSKLGRIKLVK